MQELENKAKKLSYQQKSILKWLVAVYEHIEEHGNEFANKNLQAWGVEWHPGKMFKEWNSSDRASFSRAIKRLEERGLIIRNNIMGSNPQTGKARESKEEPHDRTNRIILTNEGRYIAKKLLIEERNS